MALTPGAAFGAYQILEPLGRGGMASVFKAYESSLDRFVALKVLPPEFLHDESFSARFEREAKVVARLEHPNIIPIFSFGIESGTPWMAMRLIGGGSLSAALKSGPYGLEKSVAVIRAVADALSYAHGEGVVHRDVKPQNILLDPGGRVYLADFGIARMVEGGAAITRTGLVSGTPQYMAPEQATGQALDYRMDIYALGIVAYEMFTGRTPFSADTPVAVLMKQVSAPVPIPPKDEVPEAILGPLVKCLAKNPDDRWQSASDFAAAIEKGLGQSTTAVGAVPVDAPLAPTVPTPRPPARPASARPVAPPPAVRPPAAPAPSQGGMGMVILWLGLGLGALLFIAALLGFWLWQRSQVSPVTTTVRETPTPTPVPTSVVARDGGDQGVPVVTPPPSVAPVGVGTATPAPTPIPRPTRPPTAAPIDGRMPAPTLAAPTPSPVVNTPVPAPPTTVPTPPPPTPPPGLAFRIGEHMTLSEQVGPVTLVGVTFKSPKPNELEAQLDFTCAKGHDQKVTYEVTLRNASGSPVLTLKGQQGVEEKDKASAKRKEPVAPGLVDTVRFFAVTFTTVPD